VQWVLEDFYLSIKWLEPGGDQWPMTSIKCQDLECVELRTCPLPHVFVVWCLSTGKFIFFTFSFSLLTHSINYCSGSIYGIFNAGSLLHGKIWIKWITSITYYAYNRPKEKPICQDGVDKVSYQLNIEMIPQKFTSLFKTCLNIFPQNL